MTENEALASGHITEDKLEELQKRLFFRLDDEILLADLSKESFDKAKTPGVYLSDDERKTHMHVMGSSGGGKSKLIEFMIRQDIKRGVGVCVIDPHAELYWNILRYIICETNEETWRRVYLLNPSQEDYLVSYNPLIMKRGDHKAHALRILECLDKVLEESITEKFGVYEGLKSAFKTAAIRGYSTHKIKELLSSKDAREDLVASFNTNPLGDVDLQRFWIRSIESKTNGEILHWAKARFDILSESTPLELMCLQEDTLDLREVIQNNGILLVNLADSDIFNRKSSRTLGTMLISEILSTFKGDKEREEVFTTGIEKKIKPFYMYVDEFHEVYTDDFKDILTGLRKFGLHLILANQEFSQLTPEMRTTIKSVGTKAYFPVRDFNEAQEIFLQLGIYRKQIKDQVTTYTNLKDSEYEMPTYTVSTNARGEQTYTQGSRTVSGFKTIETVHKQYYSAEEVKLMEGKKFQLLPARTFLFHSKSFDEGIYLKTDWVFNYPVEQKYISMFHRYIANEKPSIYKEKETLIERLNLINNPLHEKNEDNSKIDSPNPFQ
jgi:hypothetical protein